MCAFFHLDTSEEKECRETSASPFRSYGMNGCFYSQEAMNVPGAAVAITSFSCREEKKEFRETSLQSLKPWQIEVLHKCRA